MHQQKKKPKAQPSFTVLVDGDIFIYQAAAAAEQAIQWTDDLWTLHSTLSDATRYFTEKLWSALEAVDKIMPNHDIHTLIALSDPNGGNFRKDVWPEYKANRKTKRSPLVRSALYQHVIANYETYTKPYLEADDILGILQTSPYIIKGGRLIISSDKDFMSIPGHHYNMDKDMFFTVNHTEAALWHLTQTLMGDAADGYPGCPGVGPKKAEALLEKTRKEVMENPSSSDSCEKPEGEVYRLGWPIVLAAYEKAGFGSDYALTMARLARICQRDDYDFKKKEVILWTPPE